MVFFKKCTTKGFWFLGSLKQRTGFIGHCPQPSVSLSLPVESHFLRLHSGGCRQRGSRTASGDPRSQPARRRRQGRPGAVWQRRQDGESVMMFLLFSCGVYGSRYL